MSETNQVADQVTAVLAQETAGVDSRVKRQSEDRLTIDGRRYQLVVNYRDAFDVERLAERYTDILDKYDFIVGDWGYDQVRLRGFYAAGNRFANKDQLITTLQDYLYEYCNFGCAYFVIERLDKPAQKAAPKRPRNNGKRSGDKKATGNRRAAKSPGVSKAVKTTQVKGQAETVNKRQVRRRHFTIHQRDHDSKPKEK